MCLADFVISAEKRPNFHKKSGYQSDVLPRSSESSQLVQLLKTVGYGRPTGDEVTDMLFGYIRSHIRQPCLDPFPVALLPRRQLPDPPPPSFIRLSRSYELVDRPSLDLASPRS